MRFLHTGDWHVGRTIRGHSRSDEFEAVLSQVVEVAADQKVDAVLVAGDIHDQRAVTPDADGLIFDTYIRLHEAGIPVVAIPGNHDSAARLAAFAPLLERIGVTAVAKMRHPKDGGLVEVASLDGDSSAVIACIPFVSPRRFSDAAGLFEDLSGGYKNFDESMGILLQTFEKAFRRDAVNIVLGHMFVSGAQPGGSEREVTIGADYAVSPARLPATASYVALGHIHKPQKVKATAADTRYCGSLLQLDFGEKGQDKSLVVVDVAPGKPPKTTTIPIEAGRRLLEVNATLDELPGLAEKVGDAFVRVNLSVDSPVPGIADRVRDALPNALDVRLILPDTDKAPEAPSLSGLDPRQQFVSYYESAHQGDPPDVLLTAFDRVYEEVVA
ncbi:MAG: repair protein SbcD/Mre11 [Actinomycetota bacterium]|jgi:exonuclease SbcD|nr:repair protein SbcD/Mre11 [Actinomycetota bacterium]